MVYFGLFCSNAVYADTDEPVPSYSLPATLVIQNVKLIGLTRTKENVVHRELLFDIGDTLNEAALQESVQRLKNTRLFAKVQPVVHANSLGKATITLYFEEKWTFIPIFRGGGDEGIVFFVLGVWRQVFLGGPEFSLSLDNLGRKLILGIA